jgi:hypothetical protein
MKSFALLFGIFIALETDAKPQRSSLPPFKSTLTSKRTGAVARGGGTAPISPSHTAAVSFGGEVEYHHSSAHLKTAARLLGYCVTLGSFTLKVPQIQKCLGASSVEGISFTSTYFDLTCCVGSTIYHYLHKYPISSWAENISLVGAFALRI